MRKRISPLSAKEEVDSGEMPKWTKRSNLPNVTKSWQDYMVKQIVQDFQAAVLQVSDSPYDRDSLSNTPTVNYEFPNGYNAEFGADRYRIPESLFDPSHFKGPQAQSMLSVAHEVTTAVGELAAIQIANRIFNAGKLRISG